MSSKSPHRGKKTAAERRRNRAEQGRLSLFPELWLWEQEFRAKFPQRYEQISRLTIPELEKLRQEIN